MREATCSSSSSSRLLLLCMEFAFRCIASTVELDTEAKYRVQMLVFHLVLIDGQRIRVLYSWDGVRVPAFVLNNKENGVPAFDLYNKKGLK